MPSRALKQAAAPKPTPIKPVAPNSPTIQRTQPVLSTARPKPPKPAGRPKMPVFNAKNPMQRAQKMLGNRQQQINKQLASPGQPTLQAPPSIGQGGLPQAGGNAQPDDSDPNV